MFFRPRKRTRRSSLGIEQLEVRIVPTVTVHQTAGHLFITGDKAKDTVTVTGTDPGEVDVTHDGDTTSFTDVDDITISTGRGDDTVTVVDLDITGNLAISTGTGQDIVAVNDSDVDAERKIGGDLSVRTGLASDEVSLDTITVGGNTHVSLSDGKDTLTVSNCTFEGDFSADGGNDRDTFVDGGGNDFMGDKVIKHLQRRTTMT